MKLKSILDYYDIIYKEFPNIPKQDIRKILMYGWKQFYLHNSYGGDVLFKRHSFWLYCGRLCKDALEHFKYYKRKLKIKLRILYKRNKIEWDGYYYFGLSQNKYEKYKEEKNRRGRPRKNFTFENIILRKIYDECILEEVNSVAIFRVPFTYDIGFDRFFESFTTDKAELITEKDPTKMKDIMTSNYLYDIFKNKKYKT